MTDEASFFPGDGLGEQVAGGEEANVNGDGVPVRDECFADRDDSLLHSLLKSPRSGNVSRERRRWALFPRARVGADGAMLQLEGKVHEGACRKVIVVLGLDR